MKLLFEVELSAFPKLYFFSCMGDFSWGVLRALLLEKFSNTSDGVSSILPLIGSEFSTS